MYSPLTTRQNGCMLIFLYVLDKSNEQQREKDKDPTIHFWTDYTSGDRTYSNQLQQLLWPT